VVTVKETTVKLGSTAQDAAMKTAGKARDMAARRGDKAGESAADRSTEEVRTVRGAAETSALVIPGFEPGNDPGANPLPESAQAIIDRARHQANASIHDASVKLETAPVNTPADTVDVVSDVDPGRQAEDVGDTARNATSDTYRE